MKKPTEPGYYWYQDGEKKEDLTIVEVLKIGKGLYFYYLGSEEEVKVGSKSDTGYWIEKIKEYECPDYEDSILGLGLS